MLFFPSTGSNIRINARALNDISEREAHEWEASVFSFLRLVRSFQTGRAVIESILHLSPRRLYFIPGVIETGTLALFSSEQTLLDSTRANAHPFPCEGGSILSRLSGTGRGVTITRIGLVRPLVTRPDALLDIRAVMVHEMTHAFRYMTGQVLCTPQAYYQQEEEFYAILVANIFASEVGLGLRDSFLGPADPIFATLCNIVANRIGSTAGPAGSREFTGLNYYLRQSGLPQPSKDDLSQFSFAFAASHHGDLIRELSNQVPFLFNRLRSVSSAPFNPIRDITTAN